MTMTRDQVHTFLHCKTCVMLGQTERLEVGLTATGMLVCCRKHGVVGGFTPEQLSEQVLLGPRCDCCPGGQHSD
jgi:hypothetical protein